MRQLQPLIATVLAVMIRPIVDADLPRIFEINAANVPEVGEASLDHLRFLVGESVAALAVDVDGEVVGFCLVLASGSTYDSLNYGYFMERNDNAWYLDRVAVDASAQGSGFGSALYAEIQGRASAEEVGRLTLEVNVDPPNEPSLAFHAKHGFTEVGRQMSHGIEVSLMEKLY